MPRVLGIDSSLTATGLCRIDIGENDDGPVLKYSYEMACATVGAPKPTADKSKRAMARRVMALADKIEAAICTPEDPLVPDLIVVESLAYGAKGDSAWVLPWVFGKVIELAETYKVPLITVGTTARAKYATGRGNADKDTVMLAAVKRWPEGEAKNNNEADALIVAAIGCHYLGMPITEPTAYMAEVLEKVSS
jgi:Holliday junction resolvasome RuvABC endonuclease subunit